MATINSDDPAYFGGYMNENYIAVAEALKLSKVQIVELAKNSFAASFLDKARKEEMIEKIEVYYRLQNGQDIV
jgi:adenosine deaminase